MRCGYVKRATVTNKHSCLIQVQDSTSCQQGETAPNTTEGTIFALTGAEASDLHPLARRLHSLMMKDTFVHWTFLLAIREANLPLRLRRIYISQYPRFWKGEHHYHLILTPHLRDLHMTVYLNPNWPTIFKSFAHLAPNIEFLSLDGQATILWGDGPSSIIEEHMFLSITSLSQLKTLRLPSITETLLIKLLPKLALLPKLEALYSNNDPRYDPIEHPPSFIGFPAFRSLQWGHSVTLLPDLFQSIRSLSFSSLHVTQRTQITSSVFKDVLQCLAKLHRSSLASFVYCILFSFDDSDVDTSLDCITIDTIQPLLDCQNLTSLELTGRLELRLLPDDIRRICDSLSKLQSLQAATNITDEDGNSLLTTIHLQPLSRLPDLERLLIQFDGSANTADELRGIPESTSKLQYFDVSMSIPPASARDFISVVKKMFPQLESLAYETITDSTGSELSDDDLFEDKQKPRVWDKVSSMLRRKRRI